MIKVFIVWGNGVNDAPWKPGEGAVSKVTVDSSCWALFTSDMGYSFSSRYECQDVFCLCLFSENLEHGIKQGER